MTTKISADNIQTATLESLGGSPTISNVYVTDSSYTILDDTAISLDGGYVKITGTKFASGCSVIVNKTPATSVTFISATEIRAQLPALSAGTYVVYVINADGSVAIRVNGITYSATPTWTTGSFLPGYGTDDSISIQLAATGATSYSVQSGSTIPTGLTLTSGGLLSGVIAGLSVETTYNFTILAIDAENQDSPRTFSITITAGDMYWPYTHMLLSPSKATIPFNNDASTNNFDINVFGDTRPYNSNPYTPGYYSNYFDGSTGKLTLPTSASMSLDAQFTIECWVYWGGTAAYYQNFIGSNNTFTSNASFFRVWGTGSPTNANKIGIGNPTHDGVSSVFSTNSLTVNTWNHVAATRDSSNIIRVFINGNLEKTGSTDTSLYDFGQGGTCIGDSPWDGANGWYSGYISNLRVIKGSCLYTTSFTPSTSPLTAVANTSLLTCQSNRFLDNSTNAATLTLAGSVSVKPFTPYVPNSSYSTYGSTYFDGTGDYLATPSSGNFTAAGDFTFSCWVYPTSFAVQTCITTNYPTNDSNSFSFEISTAGAIVIYVNGLTSVRITSSTNIPLNSWSFITLARSSTTTTLYINGVSNGTYSGSYTLGNATRPVIIGMYNNTQYFTGYIADYRWVTGSVITTVPTTPLTAIANTSLLTCQSNQPVANNTFLDNSTNNFAITRNGNTTQGTFSPYGAGYSVYFPNASYMNTQSTSGAYTSIPNTSNFDLGTGDFTMEGWIYPMQLPSADTWPTNWQNHSSLFGRGTASQADGYNLVLGATKLIFQSSDTAVLSGTHNITVNNWYHVAVSRTSGTLQLFVNGVSVASVSYSSSPGGGANFYIGCETGQGAYFYGYMSNVRLVKGTGLYTTTFTPSQTPLQTVAGTQVLTNQSQSFIDNSPNFGVVTATNSPSIQRLSPFSGTTLPTPYYSNYFDGTGDYLSFTPNSSFAFGTGDFTVECWYYPTSAVTSEYLIDNRNASQLVTWVFTYNWTGSNSGTLYWYNGSAALAQASGSTTTNAWNHIVYVRSGTTGSMYINGTRVATQTDNTNYSNTPLSSTIGNRYTNTSSDQYVKGYLSNFRVVNGTAVYDPTQSTITVPTSPLTAVANTKLLTCQSNTFVDNSTNNFTITANGDTKPRAISPFTLTYSSKQTYSKSVIGGSMYFDGTGDYLTCSNSALAMGTGSFTWEAWIYWTTGSGYRQIFSTRTTNGSSTAQGSLALVASSNYLVWFTNASIITTTVAVPANAWAHVAMVRSGTAMTLYLNGVNVGTATNSDNLTASVFSIGANNDGSEPFTGYISDVRVIKGQALYTSNFAPQNYPLQAVKNTILLESGTSAGIYDSAANIEFEALGDAKINTSTTKFSGTSSMYFDGTGDYLYAVNRAGQLDLTSTFTLECWINPTTVGATNGNGVVYIGNTGSNDNRVNIGLNGARNFYFYTESTGGTSQTLASSSTVPLGSWTHIALVRNGNVLTLYVNGTSAGTLTMTLNVTSPNFYIGFLRSSAALQYWNGYITDFRFTKGIARYTANFDVPTVPFFGK